jgi:plasmid stabilization system protein ParE
MAKETEAASKNYEVRISSFALQNLDEITGYIAFINQQPLNAIKVGDEILKTFERIATNPFLFPKCIELPTKRGIYRKVVCMSWIIIYKITGTEIFILGILHSSRKPSRLKALRRVR